MLLDKKRVSLVTKIGAVVITVAFVASLMVWLKPSYEVEGPTQNSLTEQQKNYQEEIKNLEKAVKANPKNLNAWIALGDAYFELANIETQLISSAKSKQKVVARAAVYWSGAARAYRQALALNPKDYSIKANLAVCYLQMGQLDKSINILKEILSKKPNFAPAYFYLGVAYRAQNKPKEAAQAWEKFLKLSPSGQEADFIRKELENLSRSPTPSATPGQLPTPNK